MISLQEFFNRPEHAQAKGIVQKNNIIKRNIIAHMAIAGDSTLADLAKKLHISIPTVTKLVEELLAENIIADQRRSPAQRLRPDQLGDLFRGNRG